MMSTITLKPDIRDLEKNDSKRFTPQEHDPKYADLFAHKSGKYDPQKLRNILNGNFEQPFENDDEFDNFMRVIEESRLSQVINE